MREIETLAKVRLDMKEKSELKRLLSITGNLLEPIIQEH